MTSKADIVKHHDLTLRQDAGPSSAVGLTPPGPDIKAFSDLVSQVHGDPLAILQALQRQYGNSVKFDTSLGSVYLFCKPDDIKAIMSRPDFDRNSLLRIVLGTGLVTADGSDWARHRRLLQPAFSPKAAGALEPVMTAAIDAMLDRWRQAASQNQSLDIAQEMTDVTLAIILPTLFGTESADLDATILETFTTFRKIMDGVTRATFEPAATVSASSHRALKDALQAYDAAIFRIIQTRRQRHDPGRDLLGVMLQTDTGGMGRPLTDKEVRDELTTMILAGHETTGTLLAWCWHLLTEHPQVEAKLYEQLITVVGDRPACAADVPALTYMRMVVNETLRLYPPVWHLYRRTRQDTEIGGYHVPAKSAVLASPYLMHRDPTYWTEPERFDPERFSPQNMSRIPRHVYLPFGVGQHVCIGQYLAMLEAMLVLARVVPCFQLSKVPGQQVETKPMVTLRPKRPLKMTLQNRCGPALAGD